MDDKCWNWNGDKNQDGYGRIQINFKKYFIHRIVYELIYGSIPKNLCVLHRCDNRLCFNPQHLYLGTRNDNMKDMVQKNRSYHPIGEKNSNHKLTIEEVKEIRLLYSSKQYTQKTLSEKFNITRQHLSKIIKNKIWVDI